jgi:DNA-binding NarL/FixJ family response regulator
MARTCCLAGIDREITPLFGAVFRAAGVPSAPKHAGLNASELGRLHPDLLVCDVDDSDVDALELLRRIRFVLPECVIAVYTGVMDSTWSRACHLAGANCLLSKDSSERDLAAGLRGALASGCYTDPRFAA